MDPHKKKRFATLELRVDILVFVTTFDSLAPTTELVHEQGV